jgi:hypothetical protein
MFYSQYDTSGVRCVCQHDEVFDRAAGRSLVRRWPVCCRSSVVSAMDAWHPAFASRRGSYLLAKPECCHRGLRRWSCSNAWRPCAASQIDGMVPYMLILLPVRPTTATRLGIAGLVYALRSDLGRRPGVLVRLQCSALQLFRASSSSCARWHLQVQRSQSFPPSVCSRALCSRVAVSAPLAAPSRTPQPHRRSSRSDITQLVSAPLTSHAP